MHHLPKLSGLALAAIIGAVVVTHLLAAAIGWYAARGGTSIPQVKETPTEQSGKEDSASVPVIQSHWSFNVRSDASSRRYQPQQPTVYTFSIVDDQGTTIKDFATVHEKIMHIIVIRKDLQEFQHVHPNFNQATGNFTLTDLTFPADGPYRIFADFTPMTSQLGANGQRLPVTVHEDITVGTLANYQAQSVTDTSLTKTFKNYQITLTSSPTPIGAGESTTLTFALNQNGRPVNDLEKYLGALGHAVVLREGDLEFLHTHAFDESVANQTGTVDFAVTFPSAGKYKIFGQFQHQGQVITTDYVITVQGVTADELPITIPDHGAGH